MCSRTRTDGSSLTIPVVVLLLLMLAAGAWAQAETPSPDGSAAARPASPAALAATAHTTAEADLPDWTEGLTWTVKAEYRRLPTMKRRKDTKPEDIVLPGWSTPAFWAFRVKRVKTTGGGVNYLIQVRDKDGASPTMASLFLTRFKSQTDGADVISLMQGKFYALVSGKTYSHVRAYSKPPAPPRPVLADDSIIPYAMPALPFLPPAPPGQKPSELSRTFKITEMMDDLPYARDVVQVEHQNKTLESFVGPELVEYMTSKGWPTTGFTLVELRRKFDGMRVKQVWARKAPWFIYCETPSARSWLWGVDGRSPFSASPAPSPAPTPAPASPVPPASPR
ncbi:MAG: hypothetical protein HY815_21535 [Candidatus Riflebacteria bacterium]|nr:hypothetical protein [Candidatus Riflebacteria bacterium]